MNFIEVIMVSIGLSLDVFAVMLCKGSLLSKIDKKNIGKSCIIFAFWQTAALLLGTFVTEIPVFRNAGSRISKIWYIISVIIFALLGIYMLFKRRESKPFIERLENDFPIKVLCLWACITSLDAFFAGIGLGFLNTAIFMAVPCLFVITILFVIAGTYAGYRFGFQQKKTVYLFSGILLLAAAADIFIRYL